MVRRTRAPVTLIAALTALGSAVAGPIAAGPSVAGLPVAGPSAVTATDAVLFGETFNDDVEWSSWSDHVQIRPYGGPDNSRNAMATYDLVRSSSGSGSNRIVRNLAFTNPTSTATTLSYRIKFESDFTTTMGGKFLGVGPVNFVTGGRNTRPDGWSARVVMDGRVPHLYIYDQDRNTPFGRKIAPTDMTPLPTGQWHSISLYVSLNSAGDVSDGTVELHVDGVKRAEFRNARLRGVTTSDTLARTMLFHTFFGGASTGTPIGTAHARFDDIYVREGRVTY